MKNYYWLVFLSLSLFRADTTLADCLNCWVNPKTGQLEPFGGNRQQSSTHSSSLIVYGSMNCPATRYLLQELQQQQIAYQFKDTDQPGVNEEYWQILRQANFNGKPVLPMVYVRSKVLMGPSIDQIRAVQSGQSATH